MVQPVQPKVSPVVQPVLPDDYVCHIPTLTLRRVVEVGDDGTYLARERGQMHPTRIKAMHCRLLPKVEDTVVILAANWLRHLTKNDSYRLSIDLSEDESFWLQQVARISKVSPATGTCTITAGNQTLVIPHICLERYYSASQVAA